ncbi:MAG: peptidase MA family metallohydrolase [Anaerolineales bacterium]|nr:peptidase MA family metallohydrolase [Anaerolineales bacterium]MCX7756328.1 peptidase MA family metallohydrolase [Anaerolineales bacterium]MDW8279333.1 peptidase MA family metallohydrolase [Anaerolineales bacterium]
MRRLILLLLLFFLGIGSAGAQSGAEIPVSDLGISYLFGEPVTFQARLRDLPGPVAEAYIVFRAEGEAATRVFPVTIEADGMTRFTYAFEQGPLRPFAPVRYFYVVKLQDGRELQTNEFSFQYLDNRFPWSERETDGVKVHWYAGGEPFGQAALDAARRGMQRIRELLLVVPAAPIDVYIYASVVDLQRVFEMSGLSWAGGHASPDLRVALMAIAPGPEQGLEMDRKIPHELAHILTYDLTRERYFKLPVWLREGIASRAELSFNPDYGRALALSTENGTLLAMNELCGSFPPDSGRAFLAYAQSEALTRYLIEKYGQAGLLALLNAYGDGLDCEQGTVRALGKPLSQLQAEWQNAALGRRSGLAALGSFLPYFILLAVLVMIPLTNAFLFWRPAHNE